MNLNMSMITRRGRLKHLARVLCAVTLFALPPHALQAQIAADDSVVLTQPLKAPAPGVDLVLDDRVKAVASRLRCPVCQGESIQDSPAELAAQMKLLVREKLAEGKTEDEVIAYFEGRYGQWIMLEPKAEGFNLVVYLLPVFFLLFGGIGIWFAVKKWTATPAPPSA